MLKAPMLNHMVVIHKLWLQTKTAYTKSCRQVKQYVSKKTLSINSLIAVMFQVPT